MLNESDIKIINNIDKYVTTYSSVKTIIENTVETWQPNRTKASKEKDTKLGKLAEDIFASYIKKHMSHLTYLSYDDFRTNNFKKHAPFDGVIFNNSVNITILKTLIDKINVEITENKWGKISDKLKAECLMNHIFIVEVKSTRVINRHLDENNNVSLTKLLEDDFLEYPKYLRIDKYDKINGYNEYVEFSKKYRGFICKNPASCIDDIKAEEKANMRHIYSRVYIDEQKRVAYIIGVISNKSFISSSIIKKMKQKDKSELALYIASSLRNGTSIDDLSKIK